MTAKEVFSLGVKWIGVYCLVLALSESFKIFPLTLIPDYRTSRLGFEWAGWLSLIGPAAFLALGIDLIRSESYIHRLALRKQDDRYLANTQDFFDAVVRIFGVYLVAGNIPTCLWLVAIGLIAVRAEPFMSVEDQMEGLRTHTVPTLATLTLGAFCLFRSYALTGLVFRGGKKTLT